MVETDYRVDRSVEQVVKGEGAIERMTVSVMVPRAVDAVTLKAIRQLVANAVGLREGRGDAIEVSSLPVAPAAAPTGATTAGAAVAPGAPRAPLGHTACKSALCLPLETQLGSTAPRRQSHEGAQVL